MKDLKQQFQKETNLSFNDIPINGVHLEYINWLEERIEALSIANVAGRSEQLPNVQCAVCSRRQEQMLKYKCPNSACPH